MLACLALALIRGGELRTPPVLIKEVDTVDNPHGLFCVHRNPHSAEVRERVRERERGRLPDVRV